MIVCHCSVVGDRAITAAMDEGATTLGAVCRATGAGQGCGGCVLGVRRLMHEYAAQDTCPLHPNPPHQKEHDAAPQPSRRRVA